MKRTSLHSMNLSHFLLMDFKTDNNVRKTILYFVVELNHCVTINGEFVRPLLMGVS